MTGRQMVGVSARRVHANLSNIGPSYGPLRSFLFTPSSRILASVFKENSTDVETPMLYPSDISRRLDESEHDPPETANGELVKVFVSNLSTNAESVLVRLDVNDEIPVLRAGSCLIRLKSRDPSRRRVQPGRFDQWIDKNKDNDGKIAVHFVLPNGQLLFTDDVHSYQNIYQLSHRIDTSLCISCPVCFIYSMAVFTHRVFESLTCHSNNFSKFSSCHGFTPNTHYSYYPFWYYFTICVAMLLNAIHHNLRILMLVIAPINGILFSFWPHYLSIHTPAVSPSLSYPATSTFPAPKLYCKVYSSDGRAITVWKER